METPILYLHKDRGFVKYDWGMRMLEQDIDLTVEVLDSFMVVELAEFLFRTGEFRCPHAQADVCPAVEDSCTSGILHLLQLPKSPLCRASKVLKGCGVTLPVE